MLRFIRRVIDKCFQQEQQFHELVTKNVVATATPLLRLGHHQRQRQRQRPRH